MSLFSRADTSYLAGWWWTLDRGILSAVLILSVFGAVMVATASPPVAEHLGLGSYHFLKRHLVFLALTLVFMIGVSMLPCRMIWRLGTIIFAGSVVAMVLVLLTGSEIKGAQRWIRILGFSVQPSEFVKPAFLVLSAWFMAQQKEDAKFPGLIIAAGLYGLVLSLLLLQPDLGMSVVVTFGLAVQIFLLGFPFRYLLCFGGLAGAGLVAAYFNFDHVKSRIDRFLNPKSGDNFQIDKSLEAFQNGGVFGLGPGHGQAKYKLPDAHADFIFSVAGEELGLLFVLLLLGLFGFIIVRGFGRILACDDLFIVLAVGGLVSVFGLQAFVHMGSALSLLPTKGMTLPFISYGGSSMVAMGFLVGSILALTRFRKETGISKAGLSLQRVRLERQDKSNG